MNSKYTNPYQKMNYWLDVAMKLRKYMMDERLSYEQIKEIRLKQDLAWKKYQLYKAMIDLNEKRRLEDERNIKR